MKEKSQKNAVKPYFAENPHNLDVNHWVFARGKIGVITDLAKKTENFLQFWVKWQGEDVPVPEMANGLQKLDRPVAVAENSTVQEVTATINITLVKLDPNLQQRVKLDQSVVEEYALAFAEGHQFPPITIWLSSEDHQRYLVDGFHRIEAAKIAGITELPFTEKSGTYREALLFSLSVNSTHGLRRSNADKRKVVMTLLQDSEWSQWSDRAIAKQCQVSHTFVAKLRNQLLDNENSTVNVASCIPLANQNISTVNVASSSNENNKDNVRSYIKDGVKGEMRVGNIGKGQSSQSPDDPVEDISEEEENNVLLVENEDKPENPISSSKATKGKQKLTNPLSIGNQVKVKDYHYFGGREGIVTQITSPHSVIVAFDDEQRELIRLKDLDLPESLVQPQKPQKKEILIKEGLNYKAGEGCKWYVEVDEVFYQGLQKYQQQLGTLTINAAVGRFLVEKGILQLHPNDATQYLDLNDEVSTSTPLITRKQNNPNPLNVSTKTLNKLQQYINRHGEEAILKLLGEE